MTLLPAVTGSGVSDLVTARSDPATTDVFSVSELFADVGSGVLLTTDAVLTMVVPLDAALLTLSTSVNVAEAPEASDAALAMTPPVPPTGGVVRVKAGPEFCSMEMKVVPAGMTSDIVTSAAALGPALAIVIVYVTFVPATTGSGESTLVIDRSADCASTDRKSTRLNSSHLGISYAVFCLKKKTTTRSATKTMHSESRICW